MSRRACQQGDRRPTGLVVAALVVATVVGMLGA